MKFWLPALFARSTSGRRRFRMTPAQLRAELLTTSRSLASLDGHFKELAAAYEAEVQLGKDRLVAAEGTDLQLAAYIEHAGRLILRVRELEADIANRDAITVPPIVRDTSELEDQATAPIDVKEARKVWAVIAPVKAIPPTGHQPGCGLGAIGVQARGCACQPVLVGGAV